MKYVCVGLAALPELVALAIGVGFAFVNPNRLQSEEFVIRQQELIMIEKKGGHVIPSDQIEVDQSDVPLSDDT
jgi:hypothetical protein